MRGVDKADEMNGFEGLYWNGMVPFLDESKSTSGTESANIENPVNVVVNQAGLDWYAQRWGEIKTANPKWNDQQVTDELTRQIQVVDWNVSYQEMKTNVLNSKTIEERLQKMEHYKTELDAYHASGIDVDGDFKGITDQSGNSDGFGVLKAIFAVVHSFNGVAPEYCLPPDSTAYYEREVTTEEAKQGIKRTYYDDGTSAITYSNGIPLKEETDKIKERQKLQEQIETMLNINPEEVSEFLMSMTPNNKLKVAGKAVEELAQFAKVNGIKDLSLSFEEILKFSGNRLDLAKSLVLSTREIIPGKTITELVKIFKLTETPATRSLSGYQARIWYTWQETLIGSKLDYSKPLEEVARDACNMRNTLRTNAREAMTDIEWSNYLLKGEKNVTFEQLAEYYRSKGLSGDDLWRKIIEKSMESRASVNSLFNL